MEALRENGGLGETTYTLIHLLSAFWVPLLIIAISYTLVCVRYLNHILAMAGRLHRHVATETVCLTSTRFSDRNHNRPTRLNLRRMTDANQVDVAASRLQAKARNSRGLQQQPTAVAQCRTRVFRTSGLVVLCYICCWGPYNVLALWKVLDPSSFYPLSEQLNILNALIVLNSVFNPLIYGFH